MEMHTETITSFNGRFSCLICPNITFKDWEQHEKSSCHRETVERANLIVIRFNDRFVCKICDAVFLREELIGHARGHQIAPWYKPTDLLKTFYKNSVIMWKSEFYCNACDEFFPEWVTAYFHINDYHHQNMFQHQPMVDNFDFWTATGVPYERLVSEGIVANITNTTVDCAFCKCQNISLTNALNHVKEQEHSHMKDKFLEHLNLFNYQKLVAPLASSIIEKNGAGDSGNGVNAPKSCCENVAAMFIVEHAFDRFFCELCECESFSRQSVDLHIKENRHMDALTKYGCEQILFDQGHRYYCRCCDCPVEMENVYRHVTGVRHNSSLSELRKNVAEVKMPKEEKNAESVDKMLALDHIYRSHRLNLCCEICNCKTIAIGSDLHYCKRCELTIGGIERVYTHLETSEHMAFANKVENNELRERQNRFDCVAFPAKLESSLKQKTRQSDYVPVAEKKDQNDDLLQLTANTWHLEQTGLEYHETKVFSNSIRSNGTTILANRTDFTAPVYTVSIPADPTTNPRAKQSSQYSRNRDMQRITGLRNTENDGIYDMQLKLNDTKVGMKLYVITELNTIYCLVCKKTVPETEQNYFEHLITVEHCQKLEDVQKGHGIFKKFSEQPSDFELMNEYMEDVSKYLVRCHACETNLVNTSAALQVHIHDGWHEQKRQELHLKAEKNFENIEWRLHCDWYTIYKYWCIPCSEYFETELIFAEHLRGPQHAKVMQKSENCKSPLVPDFCSLCGLLWFGFRCTYVKHCEGTLHKFEILKRDHGPQKTPAIVGTISDDVEQHIDSMIKYFEQLSVAEQDKEKTLIRDLEMAVESKFPNAKAFPKAPGFRTGDRDVEISLVCDYMYEGEELSEDQSLYLIGHVNQCLHENPQFQDAKKMLSMALEARHYPTGLTCEISVTTLLAVKKMTLIKYFNDFFPPCRKLTLFLYRWLSANGLGDPGGIPCKALYWCIIFYLQKKSLLPSVGSLIAIRNHSHGIAGSQFDVSFDFSRYKPQGSCLRLGELLENFFQFYAEFDFRYDVVSPLLGQEMTKGTFAHPPSLCTKMALYINYMANDPRPFRFDSDMCVQDPLSPQRNLTDKVRRVSLARFRACCLESLHVVRSTMN